LRPLSLQVCAGSASATGTCCRTSIKAPRNGVTRNRSLNAVSKLDNRTLDYPTNRLTKRGRVGIFEYATRENRLHRHDIFVRPVSARVSREGVMMKNVSTRGAGGSSYPTVVNNCPGLCDGQPVAPYPFHLLNNT
jgi:hypothetical protein